MSDRPTHTSDTDFVVPSVVAAVVTFNPEPEQLRVGLRAVVDQVQETVVVDNASDNYDQVRRVCDEVGVRVIQQTVNRGMSGALNVAFADAEQSGFSAVLLLDQDSVPAPGLVARLITHLQGPTAIAAPRYVDRNRPPDPGSPGAAHQVDNCITSGSLVSVRAWHDAGGYDEDLFIDFVDFDFCLRLRQRGWGIVIDPGAVLRHSIGHQQHHRLGTTYGYSAQRYYWQARDMLVYADKHRAQPAHLRIGGRGRTATTLVIGRRALLVGIYEDQKAAKVTALARGWLDALRTVRSADRVGVRRNGKVG